MSERWKYQIRTGGVWGLIMALAMSIFDLTDMSFEDAFLSKKNIFRLLYFLLVGTFIIGYYRWNKKAKQENIAILPHDNTIYK